MVFDGFSVLKNTSASKLGEEGEKKLDVKNQRKPAKCCMPNWNFTVDVARDLLYVSQNQEL